MREEEQEERDFHLHSAHGNENGGHVKGSHKWGQGHCAGEDQMADHPDGRKVGLVFVERRNQRSDAAGWAWGEIAAFVIWRLHDEG